MKRRKPRRHLRVTIYPKREGRWDVEVERRTHWLAQWERIYYDGAVTDEVDRAIQRAVNALIFLEGEVAR